MFYEGDKHVIFGSNVYVYKCGKVCDKSSDIERNTKKMFT